MESPQECKVGLIQGLKDKNHIIISIDAKKKKKKSPTPFHDKNKLGIIGNFLRLIKGIYNKSRSKRLDVFPQDQE